MTQPSSFLLSAIDFAASMAPSGKPFNLFLSVIWSSKALVSANTFSPNCKVNLESCLSIALSIVLSLSFKFAPFLEKPLYFLSSNVLCSVVNSKLSFAS